MVRRIVTSALSTYLYLDSFFSSLKNVFAILSYIACWLNNWKIILKILRVVKKTSQMFLINAFFESHPIQVAFSFAKVR